MKKWVFWLLSLTWGLPLTLVGLLVAVVLELLGYEPHKWGHCVYYEVGYGWGGVDLGPVFLVGRRSREFTRCHEHGHAIQNCFWGPLMPFVICIPSAARWWVRKCKSRLAKTALALVVHCLFIMAAILLWWALDVIGVVFGEVISIFIQSYSLVLFLWLSWMEIPKYDGNADVDYYSIWFEAQASRWGEALLEKMNTEK